MRPGDWVCISCGAKPCWARTTSCFKCGEPRPRGGGAGGGGGGGGKGAPRGTSAAARRDDYLGPRGANGSRPLLGGRTAAQPAAGLARGQPTGGANSKRDVASTGGKGGQGKGRPTPVVDAEGFHTVTADRQSRPKVGGAPTSAGPMAAAAAASAPTSWAELVQRTPGPATQPARADDADGDALGDGGMAVDDDNGPRRAHDDGLDDHDFDDDGGDEEGDEEADDGAEGMAGASEEELRRVWEDSRDACKALERNPRTPPAIVTAARRECDQAEASWRAARRPHPLHKRMRWAQRAYDAAVLKQQAHQQELDEFEEEAARKRRAFLERAQVDKDRTARKLQALEEVLQQGGTRPPSDALQAAQVAANGIAMDLGPALAAVADKLPDTSMAWIELQAAMSTLATVEDVLRGTIRPQQQSAADASRPAQFDISDDPTEADATRTYDDTGGCENQATVGTGGGSAPASAPSARSTRAADAGKPAAAAVDPPKWRGPRAGDNRWGGQVWRKQGGDQTCTTRGLGGGSADDGGTTGASSSTQLSSKHAKEQAEKLLAAQSREREAAEAAKLHAEEALRLQQAQQEQQRRAATDAAAAAEALRQAQRAMAEAEAQEAARQELERQALVARTDPEELRRAQELHAQQTAIAAAGFGTAQAVAGAGLLQAAAPRNQALGGSGVDDDAARIMEMSPEELAEIQRGSMDVGRCPW